MMKLGTVIPYLEKVKKKYKSLNIPFNSVDISIFLREYDTDIDCILTHNFYFF